MLQVLEEGPSVPREKLGQAACLACSQSQIVFDVDVCQHFTET